MTSPLILQQLHFLGEGIRKKLSKNISTLLQLIILIHTLNDIFKEKL